MVTPFFYVLHNNNPQGALSSANTCRGDGSFTLSSITAPRLNGCFVDVDSSATNETLVYAVTGTSDTVVEIAVSLHQTDGGNVSRWCPFYFSD